MFQVQTRTVHTPRKCLLSPGQPKASESCAPPCCRRWPARGWCRQRGRRPRPALWPCGSPAHSRPSPRHPTPAQGANSFLISSMAVRTLIRPPSRCLTTPGTHGCYSHCTRAAEWFEPASIETHLESPWQQASGQSRPHCGCVGEDCGREGAAPRRLAGAHPVVQAQRRQRLPVLAADADERCRQPRVRRMPARLPHTQQ
jgi:hypothetical protein